MSTLSLLPNLAITIIITLGILYMLKTTDLILVDKINITNDKAMSYYLL